MHSVAIAFFSLLALHLSLEVSAGPHASHVRTVHRRHHARASALDLAKRETDCEGDGNTTSCTSGAWQCSGTELQHCVNDDWRVVQNCTQENLVCSSDQSMIGCVYTWDLPSNSTASSNSTLSSASDTAVPIPSALSALPPSVVSAVSPSASAIVAPMTNATTFNSTETYTNTTSSDNNDGDDGDDCDDGDDGDDDGSYTITSSPSSAALPLPTPSGNLMNSTTFNMTGSPMNATDSGDSDDDGDDGDDGDYDCGDDGSDDMTLSFTSTVATVSVTSTAYSASFATASSTSLGGQLFAGQNGSSVYSASSTSRFNRTSATPTTTTDFNISVMTGSPLTVSVSLAIGSNSTPSVAAASASTTKHRKGKSSSIASATSSSAMSSSTTNMTSPSSTSSGSSGSFVAPHYVIYADNWLDSMIPAITVGSFNRFILAFWMSNEGPVDDAQAWQQFSASTRQSVLEEYHAAGIALMVSAFGSTDSPTSNGADPTSTAQELAKFVKDYGFDGVDIDYEDMTAMNNNQAESWLITFQTELREQLPSPYIISHAPVAPWFTSANDYASGAYVKIHQAVGHTIDFYNIQFYNQGSDAYVDCTTLITNSGGEWPSTSVMEINSYAGVPLEKIVIGKPLDTGAADNGYMDPSTLNQCVAQAQGLGWNAGVMFWEWTSDAPNVIGTILG